MPLIVEGLVTTLNADGSTNIAPMGPVVDRAITQFTLRPFQSSHTYANLKRSGYGVFHVTDDVELIARAALNRIETAPSTHALPGIPAVILLDACRWFAFRVQSLDDREPRTQIECRVVESGRGRDFFGFNRAKHAVLEGAILATRIGILPQQQILDEFARLAIIVEKTAGDEEQRAWDLLVNYVREQFAGEN